MASPSSRSGTAGQVGPMVVALVLFLPAVALLLSGSDPAPLLQVPVYGAAFVGAALFLAWGTELAQLDLPPGLAVAILALIAILPEYAVDLLFAWQAGDDPSKAPLALANMTGANRLLIGVGWSLVVLAGALGLRRRRSRRSKRQAAPAPGGGQRYGMQLSRLSAVDVVILAIVSLYMLQLLVRSSLTLIDTALLFAAFGFYVFRLWKAPKEEPEFLGPPALISGWRPARRRFATVGFMLVAAVVILLSADPFSTSLVDAGNELGIPAFLTVQWVAPLATESAELIPAAIFAWRQRPDEGLGTLLSAKVNQWTLLVGAIPVAYALSAGTLQGLPVDSIQRQEVFLTAAQSVFAVVLLIDLRLGLREAAAILSLFLVDFAASVLLSDDLRVWSRIAFAVLYLVLAVTIAVRRRGLLPRAALDGLVVPPRRLADSAPDSRVDHRGGPLESAHVV